LFFEMNGIGLIIQNSLPSGRELCAGPARRLSVQTRMIIGIGWPTMFRYAAYKKGSGGRSRRPGRGPAGRLHRYRAIFLA